MNFKKKKLMRWPGVEPGSAAWKATMLTVTPPTLIIVFSLLNALKCNKNERIMFGSAYIKY
jgi:hypothetical protein